MIARTVTALPDRVLLLVFWITLVVAATTTAGVFYPVVVLPLIVIVVVGTWRLAPTPLRATRVNAWAAAATLLGAAAWALLNLPYVGRTLVVMRDPGFLALSGIWLTDNPSPDIPIGSAAQVGADFADLFVGSGAFTAEAGVLYIQGSPVLPGLLALGGWAAGLNGVLVTNLAFGAAALVGAFALTRRMTGSVWAVVPTAALAFSLPMLVFSRSTYTEPVVAALLLGGLVMAWSGFTTRRTSHLVLSAAMLAAPGLVRIDGAAVLVGLLLGTALVAGASTLPTVRRALRSSYLLMVTVACVVLAAGMLTLGLHSPHYLEGLTGQITSLLAALAGTVVVGLALTLLPLPGLWQAVQRRRRALGGIVTALTCAVAVILISRPLWLVERNIDGESGYGTVVAALQTAAGFAVDRERSYDEQSLTWIAWYLGWPAVLLGLVGLAAVLGFGIARRDPRLLVIGTVIAAPTLLYVVRMSITPDHVWAMRRFLPVTLPGLLVLGTWVLAMLWAWLGRAGGARRRVWAGRFLLVGLAASIVAAPVATWGPVVRKAEYSGQVAQLRAVCATLEDLGASRVVYVHSGIPYLGSMRIVCDVEVVEVRAGPSPRLLSRAAEQWEGSGPVAVVTMQDGLVEWTTPPSVPVSTMWTEIWEQTLVRVPQTTIGWTQTVWIGTIDPDGLVVPAS